MTEHVDVAIVGAGAAGLMTAIWAGRTFPGRQILLLDGARRPGAKILVAGGGRCNVTHDVVAEADYSGASRNAVRKVLRRFGVEPTVAFFRELGVHLKREETGKLFPVSDRAETVLHALLDATRRAGVAFRHPARVEEIVRQPDGFTLNTTRGEVRTARVVLATGGRSLPRSGSDGHGYELARSLGHTLAGPIHPALVPLILPSGHFLRELSGISTRARVLARAGSGRQLAAYTDSLLCTHFGLSGPAILDVSRHLIHARFEDPKAGLLVDWLPDRSEDDVNRDLQHLGDRTVRGYVSGVLPARLAEAILQAAGVAPSTQGHTLARESRRRLVRMLKAMDIPVEGDRGYNHAEVTAGGVPLEEIDLATMQSRACPGLYLCGEILNVDGRIGGFNFQWAWSTGYIAGTSVGR